MVQADATTGLYSDAEVYDILHAPGTAGEVRGLERTAREFLNTDESLVWLEPACGSGRYIRGLARRGHRAIGFDLNADMIHFARRRWALTRRRQNHRRARGSARFFVADMTGFSAQVKPESVDVAFNPINTIRHLESDEAMLQHFGAVHGSLRPGGIYLVGLSLTWYGREWPSEDYWRGSRGGTSVEQVVQFTPPSSSANRFEESHSHLIIRRGDEEEHRDSRYRLRCYSRGQWRALIAKGPLSLKAVVDSDGHRHDPGPVGYAVYILQKPAGLTRSRRTG
jgi:SAM-dependent methyltransferase